MEKRERFASRLGFILISAGCAIGLGNVWRFPYITGKYGGAAFVVIYLIFLVILGMPIMARSLPLEASMYWNRKARNGTSKVILPSQATIF